MARRWSPDWTYDTPKAQVAAQLKANLNDLRSAEAASPQNEELILLTGLVAHLAYNVDVGETFTVAVQAFEKAGKLAPADVRPEWFLASHRCQSNEIKSGMDQMLAVEAKTSWQQLPVDFWDEYINCATLSLMPAHTLRAVDHAVHLGEKASRYAWDVDVARKRYKSTDDAGTYPAHDAWQAAQAATDVQFTSQICGMGFSVHGDWQMDISDVAQGICMSRIETGPYPGRSGKSTPTILVLSRSPKPQERLEDFVRSFLKKYPSARPVTASSCPADPCIAFEIVTDTMYQAEGGGHMLAVGFAEQPPEFPGLLFEKPEAPPKQGSGDKTAYYHPSERLHRLPGTLYAIVMLDSNAAIFEKASDDFRYLLKSIQLD